MVLPVDLVNLVEFVVNFAGTWWLNILEIMDVVLVKIGLGATAMFFDRNPLNASTGMTHSWIRPSMCGKKNILLIENLLEMTVDVEIPSPIEMAKIPMNISYLLLQITHKSHLVQLGYRCSSSVKITFRWSESKPPVFAEGIGLWKEAVKIFAILRVLFLSIFEIW